MLIEIFILPLLSALALGLFGRFIGRFDDSNLFFVESYVGWPVIRGRKMPKRQWKQFKKEQEQLLKRNVLASTFESGFRSLFVGRCRLHAKAFKREAVRLFNLPYGGWRNVLVSLVVGIIYFVNIHSILETSVTTTLVIVYMTLLFVIPVAALLLPESTTKAVANMSPLTLQSKAQDLKVPALLKDSA
jgi:hypothetical protein